MKAEQLAQQFGIPQEELGFLNGWLDCFKSRHGIREVTRHGEAASVPAESVAAARAFLQSVLCKYRFCDIYNFDETGLFYRMPPNKTLATTQQSGVKGDKTRISLGFMTNADNSDIQPPLIIGHVHRPRAFQKKEGRELGFDYYWNKNAWMVGSIWEQ